MYSLDLNTNIAVERQAERVRAVRAVGQSELPNGIAQSWATDSAPSNGGARRVVQAGLVMAVLAIASLMSPATH